MEIYTIKSIDHYKVLRQTASPVRDISQEIKTLSENMIEAMIRGNGIGLAGPQVGVLHRIFTVKIEKRNPLVFINPDITATSAEHSSYEEGCLSIPFQYGEVERPASVEIQAWNEKGRPFTMEASGLLATVIQHEIDHLNGVLFVDYLSPFKRNRILKKFNRQLSDST